MKSPTLALHLAEVTRIEAQTSYKVFDDNPEQEPYPYIVKGEISAKDWSDKSTPGMEVYSTTHFWSRHPGRKEVDEMVDAVLQAMTMNALSLAPDFNIVVGPNLDDYSLLVDLDGKTRHGILRLFYLIEEV